MIVESSNREEEERGEPGAHVFINQVGYLPGLAKQIVCDRPA